MTRLLSLCTVLGTLALLIPAAGCESTQQRVENRPARTENQIGNRVDWELDRATNRAIDNILD